MIPSFDEHNWNALITAVGRELPIAWLAIREFSERAHEVDWRAPHAPDERPFARSRLHEGEFGDAAIVHWRPGATTPAHTLQDERLFHCILVGELHQRLFGAGGEFSAQWGEMRLRAPDAVLCGSGQRFSLYAPEGAVTLAIRARFQGPILMEDTDPARPAMSD